MTNRMTFHIKEWVDHDPEDASVDASSAMLGIEAEDAGRRVWFTQVHDIVHGTNRDGVILSTALLAQWLLMNWWRLRYEPMQSNQTYDWKCAHHVAAIGRGYVWPPLLISSDGEWIQLQMSAEKSADVAAIRYLTTDQVQIPSSAYESAVDEFIEIVENHLSPGPLRADLAALREELAEERADPSLHKAFRLQAKAGMDPGDAPEGWTERLTELESEVGPLAVEEVAAMLSGARQGIEQVRTEFEQLKKSRCEINIDWLPRPNLPTPPRPERPWQRGARLARDLRDHLDVKSGPLSNDFLEERLGVKFGVTQTVGGCLKGGYRNGQPGRAKILMHSHRPESQRFYLSRVLASAMLASPEDHLLSVTNASTAMQKCERSFAQEFLCPWADLAAFTEEEGVDESAIEKAADHFQVSELLIETTLVNKGSLPREYLSSPEG